MATSAIGVLAGGLVSQYLSPRLLTYTAGIGFIAIGASSLSDLGCQVLVSG